LIALLLLAPALLAALAPRTAQQASAPPAAVTFTFDRAGMPVPHFVLILMEDGSASYAAQLAPVNAQASGQDVNQSFHASPANVAAIFASARALNRFNTRCASSAKVASSGAKTLAYTGPDGHGSCAYDFSEDKQVIFLTHTLQGMAEMLDMGRRLEFDRRYDHLGLDADMQTLVKDVKEGFAVDPSVIAPVLRLITDDAQLIQRVRVAAAALLDQTTNP
jgi:hypothetical protein